MEDRILYEALTLYEFDRTMKKLKPIPDEKPRQFPKWGATPSLGGKSDRSGTTVLVCDLWIMGSLTAAVLIALTA